MKKMFFSPHCPLRKIVDADVGAYNLYQWCRKDCAEGKNVGGRKQVGV